MQRIFHPIGQGAFYSERHDHYNVVYDCGNWKDTKLADNVVMKAFDKGDSVDVLFISHFDFDHVNKIKTLKTHTKIKKVVMPLLHDDERNLLINIYRVLNFNDLTLIRNPEEFFGEETKIITVASFENNEVLINDNVETVNIEGVESSVINSGSILRKTFSSYEWIFVPYNHENINRNKKLESLLSKEGFDVDKLKNNPDYTVNEIISNRKKIKKIYTKLNGDINQNSMLLYSGVNSKPRKNPYRKKNFKCCMLSKIIYKRNKKRISCIYTGDADLNAVNIKNVFKLYWRYVGTIQIPHHGDLKSFDSNVLHDKYYFCPISTGKNNYGHPSSEVITDILQNDSYPILVTENTCSAFVEYIKFY